jgi:hypothetical protein
VGSFKNRVRNAPGRRNSNLASFGALKGLKDPSVKNFRNTLLKHKPLSAEQRRWARLKMNQLLRLNRRDPLGLALWAGLRVNWRRGWLGAPVYAFTQGGNCGCLALQPSGTLDDPGEMTGEGCSMEAPPGIDPNGPAVAFPEDSEEPNGSGIVAGLDSESVDPGPEPGESEDQEPGDELGAEPAEPGSQGVNPDAAPLDAVWQKTRALRVGNGSKQKLRVHVRYETLDDQNEMQWYPDAAEGSKTLEYDLKPGEVADLKDGDWQINATRVRIWAEGPEGKKWVRFKDKELKLVPEKDKDGNHGYPSSRLQTFVVSFR